VTDERELLYIGEDPPPPTRPRWYCAAHPGGFDEVDEAVTWALERAPTVIVRTVEQVLYWAGSAPEDRGRDDMRPWPPSAKERAEIDRAYAAAWQAADEQEAARRRHEELRDAWLRESGPEFLGEEPAHRSDIETADGQSIYFEEFSPELSAAWHTETHASGFGSPADAIAQAAGLDRSDPWVQAVAAALGRERTWRANRRQSLDVRVGSGELFHATVATNRESIREHGLDWTRMTGRGIAGSGGPELDGIFLGDSLDDVDFFAGMTEEPVDIWAARVDGLWIESGPDGWWIVNEPLPAARVRLVAVTEGPPRPFTNGVQYGLARIYCHLDRKEAQ